ncbi:MAG: glycosyltransferase family 4 protein [Cyclobacteriaceae bacterium]|nr:glycosyltransferase family 4 protein [Cyclobacteriaceae bacterium]
MRILFLSDNFPPEHNAPATRTYEHCKEWVKQGAKVTVVTCAPNFPKGKVFNGYKNKIKQIEWIEGIKVIRVWSFISPNSGIFKRSLDFVSYAITSFLFGLWIKCDIIVATSPQFFTAVSGWALGFIKRKKWVMEVRDIWPESIKAVGAVKANWIIVVLEKIELFLYRSATKIVVVTDSFKKNIVSRGIDGDKIVVIKNGVDVSILKPQPKDSRLINQLNLKNKFVVGYIGTHGLAHSLDFIIECIHKLNNDSFQFIFIGDGAEKQNLVSRAQKLNLINVQFIDSVPKAEIGNYLSILDVALVPLKRSDTFQSVIPSKIFETAALGVPILLGVDGETRKIIETYDAGLFFEPENEIDFLAKLQLVREQILENKNRFTEGCQHMANDFDRVKLARRMLTHLNTTLDN